MSEFEQACAHAHSLLMQCRYEEAERAFAVAIGIEPSNIDAQYMLAKVRYMRGDARFARDLAKAASRNRNDSRLQMQFANVLRLTGDLAGAELLMRDLIARQGPVPGWRAMLASLLHEQNQLEEAQAEAHGAVRSEPENAYAREVLVSVLLSHGRAREAMPHIRAMRIGNPLDQIWIAHEATAARLEGEAAYGDLYDYERFVGVFDIDPPAGWSSLTEFNEELEARLAGRHELMHCPFDQSMRSGTQTIGNLCHDTDDVIQAALGAFAKRVAEFQARLGSSDSHPLLCRNQGNARISTCWSVRLNQSGFHVNHIHPDGWLSSAYYVSVPQETVDSQAQSGWIKFGEPREPVPRADPALRIQPQVGRLVLFPSYMWHGTTAIHGPASRMTMAFDVVT